MKKAFIIFFIFIAAALFGNNQLLKENDVHNIMQQIFEQHVDKKEISPEILKHSYKVFIDQFDSGKIYLLDEEVKPFLNLSDDEIVAHLQEYKKDNFSFFNQLNAVVQKSIERSRLIREDLEKNPEKLFVAAQDITVSQLDSFSDPDTQKPFAKDTKELTNRIQNEMGYFIRMGMNQLGKQLVLNNQKKVLDLYEKQVRHSENQYLYQNTDGTPVAVAEKENFATMHILKALASSLDAHTTFFNDNEAYEMRTHLENEMHGIGVSLQPDVEGAVIKQLVPNSPADKSGLIKVLDKIVEIDGKSIASEPLERVMEMMRGDDGSTVTLTLKRKETTGDRVFKVALKREPIIVNKNRVEMSYENFGDGIIGKLTLHSFYQGEGISSEDDLKSAIQELKKHGTLKGIILDLRDNGGGFLTQAIKVTGLFISNGIVVISKYSNGEEQIYRDVESKKEFDGPMIVLTSKATASAAEIVAQALQDYGIALIVGDEHTYGKGSIQAQTVTDNKSTSYFKVTVGKYYTVSGKTPQIKGVLADIVVPSQFTHEHLGEKYLEFPLSSDRIPSEFKDNLSDINSQYRSWFMKYYMPTLQQPTAQWKKMIPILKKNSEFRIQNNKNFQLFLKGKNVEEEQNEEEIAKNINFGKEDLQMIEATNIMKDVLVLHSGWNRDSLGVREENLKIVQQEHALK